MIQLGWEIVHISAMMAPYLLFGFLMAGLLSMFFTPETIRKHLGKPTWGSIFKAALFGVPLPLCSCGVIPVAASLRKSGASRGAVGAFLISTPQTGVDSVVVTGSFLGWWFAGVRVILAFVTGLVGGYMINLLPEKDVELRKEEASSCCGHQGKDEERPGKSCCCQGESMQAEAHPGLIQRLGAAVYYSFVTLFNDVAGALAIGLILAGMISFWVPDHFFAEHITAEWQAFALMLVIGFPLYICSTASVAVGASLILKGISPGAVLVFLVVGPAANGATLSAIWSILGKKALLAYLATISAFAVLAGMLINALGIGMQTQQLFSGEHPAMGGFEWGSCAVLYALIAHVLIRRLVEKLRMRRSWPLLWKGIE